MNLIECLREVSDYRRKQGQRYNNEAMLLIIIMAILRGKYAYREIARFCKFNESLLVSKFGFKNGRVPSHITISKCFYSKHRNTDFSFSSIQAAFHKWARNFVCIEECEWIALDGKSIKSTVSESSTEYQNFVSSVSLFFTKKEQVLFSEKFESNTTNEINAVYSLLEFLDLRDVVFTLVAIHCQKNFKSYCRWR